MYNRPKWCFFAQKTRGSDNPCVIFELLLPPVTPAANMMLLARTNLADHVMESWRALISILFTNGVGTGCIMMLPASRLLLLPWSVQKRRGRNKVKAAVRRSRQRSATGLLRDKGNSYVIVSTICNICLSTHARRYTSLVLKWDLLTKCLKQSEWLWQRHLYSPQSFSTSRRRKYCDKFTLTSIQRCIRSEERKYLHPLGSKFQSTRGLERLVKNIAYDFVVY